MLYRVNPKNGDELSQLGFGCMRFPKKGAAIDIAKTTEMVRFAIDNGVNYFDTAYIYPGSEAALGQALSGGYRERVKIATKMPLFLVRSASDFDKYFSKQLERLKTNYIDYYLMHMLVNYGQFEKLQKLCYIQWVEGHKRNGSIKNIGFSFHGIYEEFKKIIDAYNWDFCMIQYNYIDEEFQAGKKGLKYAHSKGIPVIIMEPLRGGKLVNGLPGAALDVFKKANPDMGAAEWGLRWVWNHPEMTLLLSGMGTQAQIEENIKIASGAKPSSLAERELNIYRKALSIIRSKTLVPCTGCGYCMPCPAGVDIPSCFIYYNETTVSKLLGVSVSYLMSHGVIPAKKSYASLCKNCGKCERHCPQAIKIPDELKSVAKKLEPFWLKPAAKIVKTLTIGNKNKNNS